MTGGFDSNGTITVDKPGVVTLCLDVPLDPKIDITIPRFLRMNPNCATCYNNYNCSVMTITPIDKIFKVTKEVTKPDANKEVEYTINVVANCMEPGSRLQIKDPLSSSLTFLGNINQTGNIPSGTVALNYDAQYHQLWQEIKATPSNSEVNLTFKFRAKINSSCSDINNVVEVHFIHNALPEEVKSAEVNINQGGNIPTLGIPGLVADVYAPDLTEKTYNIIGDVEMHSLANGKEFIMEGGTTIFVINSSDNYLGLLNCRLYSCTTLWEGIRLESATTLYSYDKSEIKDAKIAIKAEAANSEIYVQNTSFINNRIGIQLSNGAIGSGMFENTFQGSASLKPDTKGGKAASYAGIVVENLASAFKTTDSRFSGLPYGITNLNSDVSVSTSTFSKLTANGYSDAFLPCGIYTNGSGLANLISDGNTFDGTRFAIADNHSDLTATGNFIRNTKRGIHVQNCTSDVVTISNNAEIRCIERGIVLYNNVGQTFDISNNKIFIDEPKGNNGIGISIWNDKLFNARISITGNVPIEVKGGSNGIRVMNAEEIHISGNMVALKNAIENQMGINVMNSGGCYVGGNTVEGAGAKIKATNAIRIVGSPNFDASCNKRQVINLLRYFILIHLWGRS
jgi:hypothetical protein